MGESPCLHRLRSWRLIVAYRKIGRLWDDDNAGLGLSWSDDHGQTWQGELALVDPKGYQYRYFHEAGMPGIVALDDDRIQILFYSFDLHLPFDYTKEADPAPWSEVG